MSFSNELSYNLSGPNGPATNGHTSNGHGDDHGNGHDHNTGHGGDHHDGMVAAAGGSEAGAPPRDSLAETSAAQGAAVEGDHRLTLAPTAGPPVSPEKIQRIADHVREIIKELDLDINDPNLHDTHTRVAKMYLEMFQGLREGAEPRATTFPNDEGYTGMVIEKDIPFYSMCSHHFIPFYGHAHIAYIPRDSIVGLSKLPRILEFYAKRPQLQERLTEQVVTYLENKLKPLGAMVVIEARHLCVEMRGVKKPGAMTVTSSIRGSFLEKAVREEFLDLLRRG
ncbi:MAG: GTP cyclohydrolase I FolE [Acidobacteriota bacterium]